MIRPSYLPSSGTRLRHAGSQTHLHAGLAPRPSGPVQRAQCPRGKRKNGRTRCRQSGQCGAARHPTKTRVGQKSDMADPTNWAGRPGQSRPKDDLWPTEGTDGSHTKADGVGVMPMRRRRSCRSRAIVLGPGCFPPLKRVRATARRRASQLFRPCFCPTPHPTVFSRPCPWYSPAGPSLGFSSSDPLARRRACSH